MNTLEKLAKLVRYYILTSTTEAGSGHPSSSLSAVELMVTLMFRGFFSYDISQVDYPNNDRLIFSKGHASPLFYSLWTAAGALTEEELLSYRKFGSRLEGHPTPALPYVEAATGSLGQGLSIGVGMALNAKSIDKLPYRTFVLLGDSEMAEGSQWEAMQIAAHYKLNNLIGILDVNRLGQTGETMYGHDLSAYEKRIASFGWKTWVIENGHNMSHIASAYEQALAVTGAPVMIIAKTIKGKGVSFIENKNGWHGKALSKIECENALKELGEVDRSITGRFAKPQSCKSIEYILKIRLKDNGYGNEPIATRKAYGQALVRIFPKHPEMVVLDGEVSNSTYAEIFKETYPDRYFEMYIAEQNMIGTALGLSRRGKIPFVSSFAAFLTRANDQIRMCQYSEANIKFCGSHAGVSIGQDGPSQMGLEDIAMFRSIRNSVVLYPSDAVSTDKLVEEAANYKGLVYIRTTRSATPIIYPASETFPIGKCKVVRESKNDFVTVVAAGITLHEALKSYEDIKKDGIFIRVIDLYSIKPIDIETLKSAAQQTKAIVVVEDHYPEGGIAEAVRSALAGSKTPIYSLAVDNIPKSGTPDELLQFENISKDAINKTVKQLRQENI